METCRKDWIERKSHSSKSGFKLSTDANVIEPGNHATMEDIVACGLMFALASVADYYHVNEKFPVSSAIPIFAFQLIFMLNEKVKKEQGMGILRLCWNKLFRNTTNN